MTNNENPLVNTAGLLNDLYRRVFEYIIGNNIAVTYPVYPRLNKTVIKDIPKLKRKVTDCQIVEQHCSGSKTYIDVDSRDWIHCQTFRRF